MPRLVISAVLSQLGHLALASQSQIPMRVGDCVVATQEMEFFFKDDGEYEKTHLVQPGQKGTLLSIDGAAPATVEWLKKSHDEAVTGSVFMHQFARVPWTKGRIQDKEDNKCLTVTGGKDGFQPVVKMAPCKNGPSDDKSMQHFTFTKHDCGPRPIRWTKDSSKCIDAVHPTKTLLTDCSGVDSQKFLFKCNSANDCRILATGGRKDMCVRWDAAGKSSDLSLNSCSATQPGEKGWSVAFVAENV